MSLTWFYYNPISTHLLYAKVNKIGPLWLVVLLSLVFVSGCGSKVKDENAPPYRARKASESERLRLKLHLPISIPLSELKESIRPSVLSWEYEIKNRRVKKGIFSGRTDITVQPIGSLFMRAQNDVVLTTIPVETFGVVRGPLKLKREFDMLYNVNLDTRIELDSTWQVSSKTSGSFEWKKTPEIGILGIKLNLAEMSGREIGDQLRASFPKIDRAIEKKLDLRSKADSLWVNIAEPFKIYSSPAIWLAIQPDSAYYSPMQSKQDTLVFGLGATGFVTTFLEDEPSMGRRDEIPSLKEYSDPGNDFSFVFPLNVSYAALSNLAKDRIVGKKMLVSEKVSLSAKEIEIYPSDEKLVAKVNYAADFPGNAADLEGSFYVTGEPRIENQSIVLDSVQFDVLSSNAIEKLADWFVRDEVRATLEEMLVFDLTDRLNGVETKLRENLELIELSDKISLSVAISEVDASSFDLYDGYARLVMQINGAAEANFHQAKVLKVEG